MSTKKATIETMLLFLSIFFSEINKKNSQINESFSSNNALIFISNQNDLNASLLTKY